MPNTKPSTDLQNNYNLISTFCHESREPVFITKNGKDDLAVMSIEVYEEITKNHTVDLEDPREELYRLLAEGRADVLAGRTRPHSEVMADMRQRINDGRL